MNCPQCGNPVPPEETKCPACGAPVSAQPQAEQKKGLASEAIEILKKVFTTQYFCFDGRMSKREFWIFEITLWIAIFVVCFAVGIVWGILTFILSLIFPPLGAIMVILSYLIGGIIGLATLLPNLGAIARRLHDTGKSGWFQLLSLICCIGGFIVLFLCLPDGQTEANEYGEVPAK